MTGDILSKNSCFEKCFALFFFAADGHVFSTSSSRLSVFLKIWKWRAVYYFRSRSSLKERVISTSTVLNICRTISWQHQVCLILRRVLVHSQRTYHHCIWRSISLVWLSSWSLVLCGIIAFNTQMTCSYVPWVTQHIEYSLQTHHTSSLFTVLNNNLSRGRNKKIKPASSLHTSKVTAHQAGAYLGFSSMKRPSLSLLPLEAALVHRIVPPALNSSLPINTPGWIEAQGE